MRAAMGIGLVRRSSQNDIFAIRMNPENMPSTTSTVRGQPAVVLVIGRRFRSRPRASWDGTRNAKSTYLAARRQYDRLRRLEQT